MFLPGQLVEWPVKAQGVVRVGSGIVVVEVPAGGRPIDHWPKDKKKPEGRQLRHFSKPREQSYVIVEEKDDDGLVMFRTPPLHAPVTLVGARKEAPKPKVTKGQQKRNFVAKAVASTRGY